jgi:16S rRNA (guanine966-N2)-methyltransferase
LSRIVGGAAGGRRLQMPPGRATRPTSDRVREGLFSSLGGDLHGKSFLDLFAGSGAVGLEAASRGAAPVLLVEREAKALGVLRANVAALGLASVSVRAESVESFLGRVDESQPQQRFDVVFVDPPYADSVDEVLQLVVERWLAEDGVVVVERASRDNFTWPEELVQDRSRHYGDTTLWYGRRP